MSRCRWRQEVTRRRIAEKVKRSQEWRERRNSVAGVPTLTDDTPRMLPLSALSYQRGEASSEGHRSASMMSGLC